MTDIVLGKGLALAITYLDQNGSPMLVTPTPDTPPVWSDTTPATETLVASTDGLTAQATSIAVGSDTINVSATVGGVVFPATVIVNVTPVPQVLTSIAIVATPTA